MKLDHLKMLEAICPIVEDDFTADMECKAELKHQEEFTQDEAREMARRLAKIYSIAHAITCNACGRKWELTSPTLAESKLKIINQKLK